MATKRLARQLGIIRRSSKTSLSGQSHSRPKLRQLFDYLIIIDFESTCWNDGRKHYSQEIIEFPAVLLNTSNGETESEFHVYVQPQEHPVLSEFCTQLTGIKQHQVDEGVPLHICLSQFSKWIQRLQKEKNIVCSSAHSSCAASEGRLCAFVTWSDWDLGVCLQYECKRKQLRKPDILNSWIDLRATYKLFYSRKPKGLNGALQDLGIVFAGREHSGLDDSRNTARLAWRMICDGCLMKITKSLDKALPAWNSVARFLSMKPSDGSPLGSNDRAKTSHLEDAKHGEAAPGIKNDSGKKQKLTSVHLHGNTHVASRNPKKADGSGRVESCLTPPTGCLRAPLGYPRPSGCTSLGLWNGLSHGSLSSNSPVLNNGLVLVSTTLPSTTISETDISTSSDCLSMLTDWEDVALIPESQDDQSSGFLQSKDDPNHKGSLTFGESEDMKESNGMEFGSENVGRKPLNMNLSKSALYKTPNTTSTTNKVITPSTFTSIPVFKLPTAKKNVSFTEVLNGKNSTTLSQAPKRKPSSPKSLPPGKKPPFLIYNDKVVPLNPLLFRSSDSYCIPAGILNRSVNLKQSTEMRKVTPPLCKCGRRTRRLNVSNGGPNHGKAFYSCSVKKQEGNRRGCGYFKWESSLLKEKVPLPPAPSAVWPAPPGTSLGPSGPFQRKPLALRPSMRS
ncbi:ERI1 exoribonuclease 2 [Hemicordylus capensis]|uniref:ERI1 exoribonuclease 2 n=1 Tax=Hemicordylus capensis TaxID=884348 RepID=UPI0023027A8F|nr:ERI1 exoribonuclease 2 [Hemicordylus capensis]